MYQIDNLSYLAGVIDCEGYIGIRKRIRERKTKNKSVQFIEYVSMFTIENASKEQIHWVHSNFGGNVYERKYSYKWECSISNILEILTLALPYLISKKDKAELMIAFRETFMDCIDNNVMKKREYIFIKI